VVLHHIYGQDNVPDPSLGRQSRQCWAIYHLSLGHRLIGFEPTNFEKASKTLTRPLKFHKEHTFINSYRE
jgi:hypothetical protein